MPLRRKVPGTPQEWLARAKSNLAMARREKTEEVFWEDLCFETQQAAEKALKAVLQSRAIRFRYVHSLEELIIPLSDTGLWFPKISRKRSSSPNMPLKPAIQATSKQSARQSTFVRLNSPNRS